MQTFPNGVQASEQLSHIPVFGSVMKHVRQVWVGGAVRYSSARAAVFRFLGGGEAFRCSLPGVRPVSRWYVS